ncbi:MAG: hypothetical protein PHX60_13530 [Giesbergeria sp.]|uniref:hypothetical protein n=1 Tax=Giesbergeria sp. TaxID=2818473 RepID=UPI00262B229E|nr:hypothetical protein [Giesbergeria sp.]MDD2610681.1 hypothetical protein [Giesbergeria sp.]
MEFATEASKKPHLSKGRIKKPFVIGAVIDLGLCLDLLERAGLDELKEAYDFFHATYIPNKKHPVFPENQGKDRGARFLDAAVIDTLHTLRSKVNESPYDSVRGAFWEGGELYPGAGFDKKSHIQIAVRNPQACIKGYFRPLPE